MRKFALAIAVVVVAVLFAPIEASASTTGEIVLSMNCHYPLFPSASWNVTSCVGSAATTLSGIDETGVSYTFVGAGPVSTSSITYRNDCVGPLPYAEDASGELYASGTAVRAGVTMPAWVTIKFNWKKLFQVVDLVVTAVQIIFPTNPVVQAVGTIAHGILHEIIESVPGDCDVPAPLDVMIAGSVAAFA
jgi:hypothetical protein